MASKVYLYALSIAAIIMAFVHLFMAATNTTTFEFIKSDKLEYLNGVEVLDLPFGRGLCRNLVVFIQRDALIDRRLAWEPVVWRIEHDTCDGSDNWWEHPWRNKYWSCC